MPIFPFKIQVTQSNPPPVVASRKYQHGGIGGRGNYRKLNKDTSKPPSPSSSSRSATPLPLAPSTQPRTFGSGRGGAGNQSITSESAIFHFDEELERLRQRAELAAPVYHVGRGGAGNMNDERTPGGRGRSGSVTSTESFDETGVGKKSLEWMRDRLGIGSSTSS